MSIFTDATTGQLSFRDIFGRGYHIECYGPDDACNHFLGLNARMYLSDKLSVRQKIKLFKRYTERYLKMKPQILRIVYSKDTIISVSADTNDPYYGVLASFTIRLIDKEQLDYLYQFPQYYYEETHPESYDEFRRKITVYKRVQHEHI